MYLQYLINLEDPDDEDEEEKCTVIINLMQKGKSKFLPFTFFNQSNAPIPRLGDQLYFNMHVSV